VCVYAHTHTHTQRPTQVKQLLIYNKLM